jgi:arylsulfatase A-like enzyme
MSGGVLTRRKILLGGTTLAAASAIGAGPSVPVAQAQQPVVTSPKDPLLNIVFILMDNLGYGEVGVYGGGITRGAPTPRIDRLAAEGMRLTNFNLDAQCTPSRSAIMTGRFAIRSGTHSIPIGGGLEGLTQWEVTIAELFPGAGYATGHFGKWHLGSNDGRLPNDQGFDEWYGIPRTTDEAFWPSEPAAKAAGATFEHIMEGRKGEKRRALAVYDLEQCRLIDAEITRRTIDFMNRSVGVGKPFYAYVPYTLVHFPMLSNPAFAGKTGFDDFPHALAEMDAHVGEILDGVDELGIRDNTIVVFTSDNGPEATWPWQGSSGPWRGYYFTHMEGSLRVPFIIRWPVRIPAGRVSNEIVHEVDTLTTLAAIAGTAIPADRSIAGVDQTDFLHEDRGGVRAKPEEVPVDRARHTGSIYATKPTKTCGGDEMVPRRWRPSTSLRKSANVGASSHRYRHSRESGSLGYRAEHWALDTRFRGYDGECRGYIRQLLQRDTREAQPPGSV